MFSGAKYIFSNFFVKTDIEQSLLAEGENNDDIEDVGSTLAEVAVVPDNVRRSVETNLYDLPMEILHNIFKYLDIKDYVNITLASKHGKVLLDQLFRVTIPMIDEKRKFSFESTGDRKIVMNTDAKFSDVVKFFNHRQLIKVKLEQPKEFAEMHPIIQQCNDQSFQKKLYIFTVISFSGAVLSGLVLFSSSYDAHNIDKNSQNSDSKSYDQQVANYSLLVNLGCDVLSVSGCTLAAASTFFKRKITKDNRSKLEQTQELELQLNEANKIDDSFIKASMR